MSNSTTDKILCTVYIDEAGDLGHNKGTQWFILSAVIVDKKDEPSIRKTIARLKSDLNVNEIHIRKIKEFPRRAYIVRELSGENFTHINVVCDTTKFDKTKNLSPTLAYNAKSPLPRFKAYIYYTLSRVRSAYPDSQPVGRT